MELRGKHVLLISPEPWEGVKLSKHHLAEALAAHGCHVHFLPPPDPSAKGIELVQHHGMDHVRYRHWLKGVNQLPKAIHLWYYRSLIRRIEQLVDHRMDLVWCFDTSRMQWFPGQGRTGVLHLVDLDILHQGEELMRSADVVFTTTGPIAERVRRAAPNATVHKVGHALHGGWLSGTEGLTDPRSAVPLRAAFAGLLATHYVDWAAMRAVFAMHPHITFDLYGPHTGYTDPDLEDVRSFVNVHFHGLLPKEQLIGHLRSADILFLLYRTDILLDQLAYPHKMLEYLSTGNVVVCSRTLEMEAHTDLVVMAMEREDALGAFQKAVQDFAALNTGPERRSRISFAQERSMDKLITRLSSLIPGA